MDDGSTDGTAEAVQREFPGAILVVKAERTKRDAAKQALRTLRDAKVHVLGAILNDVDLDARAYSGYAARYYRYGGYYGEGGSEEAPSGA